MFLVVPMAALAKLSLESVSMKDTSCSLLPLLPNGSALSLRLEEIEDKLSFDLKSELESPNVAPTMFKYWFSVMVYGSVGSSLQG